MGKGKRAHFLSFPPKNSHDLLLSNTAAQEPLKSQPANPKPVAIENPKDTIESAPIFTLVTTYLSYFVLILYGHLRDIFSFVFAKLLPNYPQLSSAHHRDHVDNGMAPINNGFDTFYHRRLYLRIRDVFNRPVTGVPGREITLLQRTSPDYNHTFFLTGETRSVLNLASYNYLGFAQSHGPCADQVEQSIMKYGVSSCSTRLDAGTLDLHQQTEALVARFLNQQDCMILSMGFATNSTVLPCLVSKGDLIISDELNHSSLVYGARASGASIRVFKHNNAKDLESLLRETISQGQPRTHRPWKRILVVIEGLYSMEGTICCLPEILELKKKYKFYLYLDEAHSIGALGPNGRGVCDYYGVDPSQVDILMGTFTKSFGAAGGYICGSSAVIQHVKRQCHSMLYAESISPPVLQQIQTSLRMIMGEIGGDEGRKRIEQLHENSRFFAQSLRDMGFLVLGYDSPVIPLLLFHPAKIPAFSREMLERGVAVVVVGYPATPLITSRVRFCVSAAHTRKDLEYVLKCVKEVGDRLCLRVNQNSVKSD